MLCSNRYLQDLLNIILSHAMRISRRQKHIKQLLCITLRRSRKLRQLANPASALPHKRTSSDVPRYQHATRWTRCTSTSRYPRGHVQLSRAPRTRTRTWWCAMLCSVCGGRWCASGWVVGEAGEMGWGRSNVPML